MPLLSSITDVIGGTPLVRLEKLSLATGVEILAKIEGLNPAGSVKDRIARAMVDDAEHSGRLGQGATIIEPTSGNTGIALAMISAARGYRLILTMPEAMSQERVALLRAYGAEVILTRGTLMQAAVEQAEALGRSIPSAVMLRQFENPANPRVHEQTTAEEIWRDTEGRVDVFVSGIGTGGTVTGVSRVLKRRLPSVRVIGVEPADAAVLSGCVAGPHHIQGIGAGFVPKVLERDKIDEVVAVTEDEALEAAKRMARSDGVLAGISSGAAMAALLRVAQRPELAGRRFVVMLPDTGERYVSTSLFRVLSG